MRVCPECREGTVPAGASACKLRGWELRMVDGIPDFVANRDRESGIFAAYREVYDRIAEDDLAKSIQGDDLLELEADRLLRRVGDVTGQSVCDIGVGKGMLLARLADAANLTGVDLALPYLKRLASTRSRANLVQANAENLPFREAFDVVVASDVLEHVLNVADFMSTAVEALKPGGRLIVKVPYRKNLLQYRTFQGCSYPIVHLRTFDRKLLTELLREAGLRVERISYSGFYAGRWHRPLLGMRRAGAALTLFLERIFGPNPQVNRIHPRVGRVLMRPVGVTAIARKIGETSV